ncbi:amidohydrolase family protein [Rathayibacter sp. CAU 1779]
MRTIGLEEHFVTPELVGYGASAKSIAQPAKWEEAGRRLLDLFDERIAEMDASGLDLQVLSLNAPGIQAEPDARIATRASATVNDFLAGVIADRPDRFRGFAAIALQDPESAADELERAITQLGFHGALVNAHTQGVYLDDRRLDVVWERAQALDVPLYLHPANGVDVAHVLSGHPELIGPMWSWGIDTSTHVLRLVFGGVFDRFPGAKLLIGHMGEGLPYALWRLDSRWEFHNRHGVELELEHPSAYLRRNLWVTTSGVCDDAPLRCAIDALGIDRVLFATDYPFESIPVATEFLRTAALTDAERDQISHRNAERLLRIPAPQPAPLA